MSNEKVQISKYIPTNFQVKQSNGLVIFSIPYALLQLNGGSVKIALRYPTVRSRDDQYVARLEVALIKGAMTNGGKSFICQPFDTSKSGNGANWVNIKANTTSVGVIAKAGRLTDVEAEIVQTWAGNNAHEGASTTAALRFVPKDESASFEFTTKINYNATDTSVLAKMPVGIDKFKFVGNWNLIDSDSQSIGNWDSPSVPIELDSSVELDLSMFEAVADKAEQLPF